MGFVAPEPQIPTAIADLTVRLHDGATQSAEYWLTVVDQNGIRIEFPGQSGDLVPHLTTNEIMALQEFMATLRRRAEEQIFGVEGEI